MNLQHNPRSPTDGTIYAPKLKWVVQMNSDNGEASVIFPWKRGNYCIGLREILIENDCKECQYVSMCMSPSVNVPTYIENNAVVYSVKSIIVKGNSIAKDFSSNIEYFLLNLVHTDRVEISFKNITGDIVKMKAICIFDVF